MNTYLRILVLILLCTSSFSCQAQSNYDNLVDLFNEFRELQKPTIVNGTPDFTEPAMNKKHADIKKYQEKLAAVDTTGWSISEQVDYHLVWAEMNAMEFHHRVLQPWKHDPGFYSFFGGDAGASMNLEGVMPPLYDFEPRFSKEEKAHYKEAFKMIPGIFEQAKANLTEGSGDLAQFAIRNFRREAEFFDEAAEVLQKHHKDLAKLAKDAGNTIRDYRQWIIDSKENMTAPAGSGKENYTWWNNKVQLSPWGWEESNAIIQREYDRIITFLKLEEQRNRNLPPLEVAMTERAYNKSLREALHYVVKFLKENEIMTIHDWVNPADYYIGGRYSDVTELSSLSDEVGEEFLPENSNVDLKYRQREILPGENHEYVGHMLDEQRNERLKLSPIKKMGTRFNMGSMRLEGWAVWMEECLMQAGVLDERPQKGREMVYIMLASHMSLSVPDMKMHANEINLAEARKLCAEITPRGWTKEDEGVVFFEMQSNLRNPGGFHSNVVTGKAYFMKLFRDYAVMKGENFVLKEFIDEFLSYGIIPMPLIRWQMLNDDSEIRALTKS